MTQREIAKKCGFSANYINLVINGLTNCNEKTMKKIKKYCKNLKWKKIKTIYKVVSDEND